MRQWPTLFKKTSTGKIQQWSIKTVENAIIAIHGQVGGKLQEATDIVKTGKNAGRSNATTPAEQAQTEAQSQWEKKKKKGYVESMKDAESGQVDTAVIEGGIEPMLAQSFAKHGAKINFPCHAQPKLDGIRCIAMIENGKATLWTRTRKPITGVPHIIASLEKAFPEVTRMTLDGELYNHAYKADFETIVSYVRQQDAKPGHEVVEYHVYDMAIAGGFDIRSALLGNAAAKTSCGKIIMVKTKRVANEEELVSCYQDWMALGYEGAMARNSSSPYEYKRSYSLQKIKEFEDAEFAVTGIIEGRGKLAGHVGSFTCETKDGTRFDAKMCGETGELKRLFENHALWQGRKLTVKFQGLTGKNGVPRFPVGIRLRDEM